MRPRRTLELLFLEHALSPGWSHTVIINGTVMPYS